MPLKLALDQTDTSPNLIIPQKAHEAIAQMHASNGSSRFRDAFSAHNIGTVKGGHYPGDPAVLAPRDG